MPTVTYKNQPAIQLKHGSVPEGGYDSPYTVTKLLWPNYVESWISERVISPCLHICCGKSLLGDVRMDVFHGDVDVIGDAARLPFADRSFLSVLIDPPYNGVFRWNHDMLSELSRIARDRIVFQHWFIPANRFGQYKKKHKFVLSEVSVWQPKTYFGRVNVISIFDSIRE
jgi:hypothetical protein